MAKISIEIEIISLYYTDLRNRSHNRFGQHTKSIFNDSRVLQNTYNLIL